MTILFAIYMAAGYWACGRTIYANKVWIGDMGTYIVRRIIWGTLLGWILIPVALFLLFFKKNDQFRIAHTSVIKWQYHRRVDAPSELTTL